MFSPALAGGASPPQTSPFLTWFSLFLVRSSANFAKKIQELAEDKAENPRTCRGQSREENPYERLQENSNPSKLSSSKLPSLSQPSVLQKPWAAVLPPGGLQSAAHLGSACGMGIRGLRILPPILLLDSSSRRFLFPPPKSSPSSLGPTPSSAAICGAGASWRLLGRKNRVPRGLQKLIKF